MLEVLRQKHHQGWEESNLFLIYNIMTFKKWQKPPKKGQKMSEVEKVEIKVESVEAETPVTTDIENEIIDDEIPAWTVFVDEEKILLSRKDVLGNVWGSVVAKPKGRIVFEAQVAPVPMFKMPKEIREYLTNNGFTTDLWQKDKEWLEKHNVDMEMVEKLKKFLTERL